MPKGPLERLKKRSEFVKVSQAGEKQITPAFIIQACHRGDTGPIRYGITASRKVGNAVERNRAKRRLRALSWQILPKNGFPGTDYVLIARKEVLKRDFADMLKELERALVKLHPGKS